MSDPVLDRRSIRKYTDQPVPDKLVETLLRAAMSAPSAGNQQPWHFVVIRDRAILDAVPGFHPYARMMVKAPVAILVCGDGDLEKSKGFWVEDCSAATENVLIEAQELGLGSVWLGPVPARGSREEDARPRPRDARARDPVRPSAGRVPGREQEAVAPLSRGARPPRHVVTPPQVAAARRTGMTRATRDAAGAAPSGLAPGRKAPPHGSYRAVRVWKG